MPSQTVTSVEFDALINENELVFLDFWADWCAPCKPFAEIYDQVADLYPKIKFAKINIELEKELAEVFNIRSIPHLMVFKEGIVIYSHAGSIPASTLNELVEQALAADVSEIKAQFEQEDKE